MRQVQALFGPAVRELLIEDGAMRLKRLLTKMLGPYIRRVAGALNLLILKFAVLTFVLYPQHTHSNVA